jgi:hypothetical protein
MPEGTADTTESNNKRVCIYMVIIVRGPKSKRERQRGHEDKGRNGHGGETAMRSQKQEWEHSNTPPCTEW